MPKLKNILIFVAIVVVLILAYVFFVKPSLSNQTTDLVSQSATSNGVGSINNTGASDTSSVAGNFLTLLLNVKTIQLDTEIFSDPAFMGLHDSTIVLVPDATTGRANPFAQFGAENAVIPTTPSTSTSTPTSNTNIALPNTSNNKQSAPAPTQSLKLN